MKPLIEDQGIFDKVEKSIGCGVRGGILRAILEQDDDKYSKSL